ncbi:MAG: metal-dependent transcriptional regulator [Anaerolineaceae bacterium]|jgi:DtxR family Mn-dependent transcriptional regulator
MADKFSESLEMYLETILLLIKDKDSVRQVEIADALAVSRPSVHASMRRMQDDGLVIINADSSVSLSAQGLEKARAIWERHEVFARFLIQIGVDPKTAQKDACKIEHDVSEQTFQCIKAWCQAHCKHH